MMLSKHSRIFISYSHRGRGPEWKAALLEHLKVFTAQDLIEAWDDEQIPGGWRWEREIETAIRNAQLAVILLTKEALESEFILQQELKPLQEREKEGTIVIPVNCGCEAKEYENHEWIKKLQIRPFEAKPLSTVTTDGELRRILRRLATEIAEELGRSALTQMQSSAAPSGGTREYLDKFPLTRGPGLREEELIGREQELALLDLAFAQPHTAVVSFVAWGGVGKTMLVQHWLQRLQREGWFGARRVYAWSFYSQGTKEDRQASEDTFLAHALEWFGVQCEPTLSPWDKGRLLAVAVARERTLLILDGIEPLQYPPGPMGGQLRAPGVQSLLKQLARKAGSEGSNCLCLVTTREPLTDLADFQRREGSPWGSVLRGDLGNLTEEAGAALLHHAGANRAGAAEIKPDNKELLAASREVDGHALTLNLLGRFLARAHGGDIRRRDLVKFEEADRKEQGGTTFKMLAAFENWFAKSGEFGARQLAVLRMLGLFDRPADAGCIAALRKPPVLAGLTDPLFHSQGGFLGWGKEIRLLPEEDWNTATSFLADFGLVVMQVDTDDNERLLDCHPLIREHFAKVFREQSLKCWHSAHRRLYAYLKDETEYQPTTIEGLQPLYHAIAHGCVAGARDEAFDEVFQNRIIRNASYGPDGFFSRNKLGAIESDLVAIRCFFGKSWDYRAVGLSEVKAAWLLNEASLDLRAQGKLFEALEPLKVSLQICIEYGEDAQARIRACNLSELYAIIGELAQAEASANQAYEFAKSSRDWIGQKIGNSILADTLNLSGSTEASSIHFRIAEGIQALHEPSNPYLYSLPGFRYCDFLLLEHEKASWKHSLQQSSSTDDFGNLLVNLSKVEERSAKTLRLIAPTRRVLDIALDRLTLGRIALYSSLFDPSKATGRQLASDHIQAAVDGCRRAGTTHHIPRGLLTRAWLRFLESEREDAQSDLDEAWDIAERGPMRLHLADIHLHRARLFFREKEYPWNKHPDGSARGPKDDLAAAEKLIHACGYHRRDEELADAKRAILGE